MCSPEQRGAYRPTTELANIELPMTVHAVLAARIDRLASEDKRLLQTAAVIGRHVPLWLLRAVSELSEDVLQESLARLQAAAFLVESAGFPEPEYALSHALTQEVAYRSVLLERRRVVHRQVTQAMEHHYGERRLDHAEVLGHHAVLGERWEQAVAYLREAGASALNRSEYAEAAAFFKESLAAAIQLPPGPDRIVQEIDIRFELRNVLWARGRLIEGLEYLTQAEPLAAQLKDQRRAARLVAHKSSNYLVLGENERALECGQEAMALACKLNDFALQVDANLFLGVLYTSLGDFHRALEYLEAIATSLVGDRRRGRFGDFYAVHVQTWRVWCLTELGRFQEAATGAEEAMRIAAASRHPHNIVAACWAAGYLERMRGQVEVAVQALELGYALCQSAGVSLWLRPSAALLGHAYAWAGRLAEGVRLLEQAVQPAENNVADCRVEDGPRGGVRARGARRRRLRDGGQRRRLGAPEEGNRLRGARAEGARGDCRAEESARRGGEVLPRRAASRGGARHVAARRAVPRGLGRARRIGQPSRASGRTRGGRPGPLPPDGHRCARSRPAELTRSS